MYTRRDYLNGKCTYSQYMRQFTKYVIPPKELLELAKESTDPHFNDIRLDEWDFYAILCTQKPEILTKLEEAGDWWTLANGVCILKEAVRERLERLI